MRPGNSHRYELVHELLSLQESLQWFVHEQADVSVGKGVSQLTEKWYSNRQVSQLPILDHQKAKTSMQIDRNGLRSSARDSQNSAKGFRDSNRIPLTNTHAQQYRACYRIGARSWAVGHHNIQSEIPDRFPTAVLLTGFRANTTSSASIPLCSRFLRVITSSGHDAISKDRSTARYHDRFS